MPQVRAGDAETITAINAVSAPLERQSAEDLKHKMTAGPPVTVKVLGPDTGEDFHRATRWDLHGQADPEPCVRDQHHGDDGGVARTILPSHGDAALEARRGKLGLAGSGLSGHRLMR